MYSAPHSWQYFVLSHFSFSQPIDLFWNLVVVLIYIGLIIYELEWHFMFVSHFGVPFDEIDIQIVH